MQSSVWEKSVNWRTALQILTIVMPGSTKLARFSSTDTLSRGILVLSPGSWVVLFIEEELLSAGEAAVLQN
jgi:hypothetical protein